MYTLRSHMSVVEYTCVFHRPTSTKSSKLQVRLSLSLFQRIPFQSKTSQDSRNQSQPFLEIM